MNKIKRLRVWWRLNGTITLFFCIVGSMFISHVAFGFCIMMMATVPCSIKCVNVYWWLWYPRQLLFLMLGMLNMI